MTSMDKRGFSLLEVLLAAVIFVLTVAGLFASLTAARAPVIYKENQLAAVLFTSQVLQTLYSQVNASSGSSYASCTSTNADGTCGDLSLYINSNPVYAGKHEVKLATLVGGGLNMPAVLQQCNTGATSNLPLDYTVSCADGTTGAAADCITDYTKARLVQISIYWPDSTGSCS